MNKALGQIAILSGRISTDAADVHRISSLYTRCNFDSRAFLSNLRIQGTWAVSKSGEQV